MRRGVLIVSPYLPWPADFGGAIRIYEFVRHLAREHNVILLAPVAGTEKAAIDHLRDICDVTAVPVSWTFRQPAGTRKRLTQARSILSRSSFVEMASAEPLFQAVMDRLFMTRHIDLVQYEFPQMARFRPLRPCPTVLDNHNIEHELLARVASSTHSLPQRAFNNIEWRKVRRLEQNVWSTATLNIATSDRDSNHILDVTGVDVPVVPNGVDLDAYGEIGPESRVPGRVVFIGAMRHQPNASGARWYAQKVHPMVRDAVPNATFEIVGADPPPAIVELAGASVSVTGHIESVVPHLARATVAVIPLDAGGGTRLKLLEAFAAGVPVVSTSVGAEGLDVEHGRHLFIADTPREFADAVIRLLQGVDRLAGYGTDAAREYVRAGYDWRRAIVPALVTAHEMAIDRFDRALGGSRNARR